MKIPEAGTLINFIRSLNFRKRKSSVFTYKILKEILAALFKRHLGDLY